MYLLIVTGLSGAGKSLCLNCLEEQGYFCVDNLPSPLLKEFVTLCEQAVPRIQRARRHRRQPREPALAQACRAFWRGWTRSRCPTKSCFSTRGTMCCAKRYNESRRRHPLGDAGDAYTGVQRERAFLQSIRNRAAYVLDTSDIKPKDLSKTIAKVLPEYESKDMSLLLCSFGYKRGVRWTRTSCSTCGSSRTPSISRSCARSPAWTSR